MNIHIDDELAVRITIQTLLESLQISRDSSTDLMSKDKLEVYEAIDLADDLNMIKHLEAVLAHYMSKSEYEAAIGKKFPVK